MAADRLTTGDNQRMEEVKLKGVRTRNTMRVAKVGKRRSGGGAGRGRWGGVGGVGEGKKRKEQGRKEKV